MKSYLGAVESFASEPPSRGHWPSFAKLRTGPGLPLSSGLFMLFVSPQRSGVLLAATESFPSRGSLRAQDSGGEGG